VDVLETALGYDIYMNVRYYDTFVVVSWHNKIQHTYKMYTCSPCRTIRVWRKLTSRIDGLFAVSAVVITCMNGDVLLHILYLLSHGHRAPHRVVPIFNKRILHLEYYNRFNS